MSLFKNKGKYIKPLKSWYMVILVVFAFWMLFFDANSWFIHNELNTEIEDLESQMDYYKKEIEKDNKAIIKLSTEDGLEKFARETYFMKRDSEEIFVLEYQDSLKTKGNE